MSHPTDSHTHDFLINDAALIQNEKRTLIVAILTAVTMAIEVIAGYLTGSMALLADGWHMASHTVALGIAVVAYRVARSAQLNQKFSFGSGKIIPLGGYTSAILLSVVACTMGYHSFLRLLSPQQIRFEEAIGVAVIGLVVNIVSVLILGFHHHNYNTLPATGDNTSESTKKDQQPITSDHNLHGAYLHVLADAFTSVLAIVALVIGKIYNSTWLDATMGIVGSLLIIKWAYALAKDTGFELLDGHAKAVDTSLMRSLLEQTAGTRVVDLHVWRIAPRALACELIVRSSQKKGSTYYKEILTTHFDIKHVIVEEHQA